MKKNFSIDEAEQLLPEISRCLINALNIKYEMELYENDSFDVNQFLRTKVKTCQESKCALRQELCDYINFIEAVGCQLHDFNRGILHFPLDFQGKKAVLCWHENDGERIKHWHYLNEPCDERSKIIDVDEI